LEYATEALNLPLALKQLERQIDAALDQELADDYPELRPAHIQLMLHLVSSGSQLQTATELATSAQISKQSVGAILDYLELHHYLARSPHPLDGRVRVIEPTTRGQRLMADISAALESVESAWCEVHGAMKIRQFKRILTEIID
jgi:DNA-binding MarR family transcriptional regulator